MKKTTYSLIILYLLFACNSTEQANKGNMLADSVSQKTEKKADTFVSPTDTLKNVSLPTEKTTQKKNTPIKKPQNNPSPPSKSGSTHPIPPPIKNNETPTPPSGGRPIPPPAPPIKNNENPPPAGGRPIPPPTPPIKNNEIPPKPIKAENPNYEANTGKKANLSHAIWDDLLKKHVSSTGKVNYKGFISDKEKLEAYLSILQQNPAQPDWDKNKQLAYWINAYNAFTIKLITDKYPTASIKNVATNPWDIPFISLGIKNYSLNQIENEIIRPQFQEPRVHFALNCAAKSCPKLLNEAFLPEKLNAQLEKQTKEFVNDAMMNTLSEKKIEISSIFDWYKADFQVGIIAFLNQYSQNTISEKAKITFKEYDWRLNE